MTRTVLLTTLLLAACHHAAPEAPENLTSSDEASSDEALPCGVASVDDLDPFGKTSIGTCTVTQLDGDDVLLLDGDKPVMRAGEAHPLVALDPRVPGPAGLRVGMTGAEIRTAAPAYPWISCHGFDEVFQCELRRVEVRPECGEGDPDDLIVVELDPMLATEEDEELEGDDAWVRIEGAALTGVMLAYPC